MCGIFLLTLQGDKNIMAENSLWGQVRDGRGYDSKELTAACWQQ